MSFLLSDAAAVVQVPRETDFGIDLLCTLLREVDGFLYSGESFSVQVKTGRERSFAYGAFSKGERQKEYEVNWLFGQDLPFFLCQVDPDITEARLYCTSRMWYTRYQYGPPGRIQFCLDKDLEDPTDHESFPRYKTARTSEADPNVGRDHEFRIGVGPPALHLRLTEEGVHPDADQVHKCLMAWIGLERANIQWRARNVPICQEFRTWNTNEPPSASKARTYFSNTEYDRNIKDLFADLTPALANLLLHFQAQGRGDELQAALPLLRQSFPYGDFVLSDKVKEKLM